MADRNDGKSLEKLVSLVESIDLPEGFKVETNKPVREDGQQIAEMDILISGMIGTVEHKTLFECRDRKSGGAQGVGWIEQLVGRRQRLKVNTIVAVSTTGFAPGAEKFAAESNIPLRKVEDLTVEEVASWLPSRAPLVYREACYNRIQMLVMPVVESTEKLESESDYVEVPIPGEDKILRNVETGERLNLLDLWKQIVRDREAEVFEGVNDVGDSVEREIVVDEDTRRAYRVTIPDGEGTIETLVYTAKVWSYPSQLPLVKCVNYGDRHVVAHWDGAEGEDAFTVILTRENK